LKIEMGIAHHRGLLWGRRRAGEAAPKTPPDPASKPHPPASKPNQRAEDEALALPPRFPGSYWSQERRGPHGSAETPKAPRHRALGGQIGLLQLPFPASAPQLPRAYPQASARCANKSGGHPEEGRVPGGAHPSAPGFPKAFHPGQRARRGSSRQSYPLIMAGKGGRLDLFEAIRTRRSVRRYLRDPIPQETLEELLSAAISAPSAGNAQPWRFIVVRDQGLKGKLVEAAYGQEFLAEAPVVVVVCADLERARRAYKERGEKLYCLQDTAAAVENLLLAATAKGLGTCWVGAFDEGKVSESPWASQGTSAGGDDSGRETGGNPEGPAAPPAFRGGGIPLNFWRREGDSNPRRLIASPVFKTGGFGRSPIPPEKFWKAPQKPATCI
jgi:hypothetical protein